MQVLNSPIDPLSESILYEVVCQTCSANIRFSRSEALTEAENATSHMVTIDCPVCMNTVTKTLNKKIDECTVSVEKYNRIPF